jgi:hypothetical protein
MVMAGVRWNEWPDYRIVPAEVTSGQAGGTIALDPLTGLPIYEFAPGDTVSDSWYITAGGEPGVWAYYEEVGNTGGADGATATVGFGDNTGGNGPPASDPQLVITYGNQPIGVGVDTVYPLAPLNPPAGEDLFLVTNSSYTAGAISTVNPPLAGWTGGPLIGPGEYSRTFRARAAAQINVQMPPYRYLIQLWVPSPDSQLPQERSYVRARQRRDGLGVSTKAARSSHVLSARSAR